MAGIERLGAADRAAAGRLLVEAYADYADRIGPDEWSRLHGGLEQAAVRLVDAEIAGLRSAAGLDAWCSISSPASPMG